MLQGSADGLAAQLAWLRLQGADPFGAQGPQGPQLDPSHRASAFDYEPPAMRHSAHDSVASLVSCCCAPVQCMAALRLSV